MQLIKQTMAENSLDDLGQRLIKELKQDKNVLWLVSGGSNIASAVTVMKSIPSNLKMQLTIMPVDERYVPVGHADSNFQQLINAGFDSGDAILLNILDSNLSLEQTDERFKSLAGQAFEEADVIIALLGIGTDGHIAGILPSSPASQELRKYVVSFESTSYTRITLTFPALRKINAAYVYAFGVSKAGALTKLKDENISLELQPAQILKELDEAYVYNDSIES